MRFWAKVQSPRVWPRSGTFRLWERAKCLKRVSVCGTFKKRVGVRLWVEGSRLQWLGPNPPAERQPLLRFVGLAVVLNSGDLKATFMGCKV